MKKNDDFGLKFPKGMKPSGRSISEVLNKMGEDFYRKNGHYMTEEEAISLTERAREEIKKEKEEELMKKNDDLDFGWDFPEGMKFSGRSLDEICEAARENFYKANGYYPTVEEAVRLTDEAREEIKKEQESKK